MLLFSCTLYPGKLFKQTVLVFLTACMFFISVPGFAEMETDINITAESANEPYDINLTEETAMLSILDEKARKHKESMIRERVIMELSGIDTEHTIDLADDGSVSLPDINPELYYVCYENTTDYVLTNYNGELYAFYVRITADGRYFLSRVHSSESAEEKFRAMMNEENTQTTDMFWNQVALSTPDEEQEINIRPVDQNGVMMVPYFNQGAGYYVGNGEWTETDWPNVTFNVNGHNMHEAGCGFFSTAMALSYLKQRIISPVEFKENGQYVANEGSAVTVGVATAEMYGVHAYFTSDINEVIEALRNGHPVMEHVGQSVFTGGGHYILLVGYTNDGMFAVNDPGHKDNTYFYNGVTFSQETIIGAIKGLDTAFTIFD